MYFDFNTVVATLQTALGEPLPGPAAQGLMAPRRPRGLPDLTIDRLRHAAGLLLLFPSGGRAHVVLTLRAETLDRHGGQVSLPGGVIEPGETPERTALREAQEEIGVSAADVRILGPLTPLDIAVSGFRLHPFVGTTTATPRFQPFLGEVARVLEVPVDVLLEPGLVAWRTKTRGGHLVECPVFPFDDAEVWGATAMVLAEFLALLGWSGPARV